MEKPSKNDSATRRKPSPVKSPPPEPLPSKPPGLTADDEHRALWFGFMAMKIERIREEAWQLYHTISGKQSPFAGTAIERRLCLLTGEMDDVSCTVADHGPEGLDEPGTNG